MNPASTIGRVIQSSDSGRYYVVLWARGERDRITVVVRRNTRFWRIVAAVIRWVVL